MLVQVLVATVLVLVVAAAAVCAIRQATWFCAIQVVAVAAIKTRALVWQVCRVSQTLAVKVIKQHCQPQVAAVAATGQQAEILVPTTVVPAVQVLTHQLLSVVQHFMLGQAVAAVQPMQQVARQAIQQAVTVVRQAVQVATQRRAIMVAVVVAVWRQHQALVLTA
jgi:hypothetical protein